jgi:dual specificity tyrosine-phosphorylation-regulated kinase 2/3/4
VLNHQIFPSFFFLSLGSQEPKSQDFSTLRPPLRQRPSLADESGGEEILYPRATEAGESIKRVKTPDPQDTPRPASQGNSGQGAHPPTSYASPLRKAKKRTSEEFELDQFGALVAKRGASTSTSSSSSKSRDEKARRHRSHGSSITSPPKDKVKDRKRDSVGLTSTRPASISTKPERHSRQVSAGSSSGQSDAHPNRRVNTTDFSHLPPSPSTTSIQQFLKHMGSSSSISRTASQEINSSPNVAHSLLRGSQEGWSGLDDDATLRKLDGLTGKSTRSRSSISQTARTGMSSRPGTPPSKTVSVDNPSGLEISSEKKRHEPSVDLTSDIEHDTHRPIGLGLQYESGAERPDKRNSNPHLSSDDQGAHSGQEKTPRKPTTPRSSIMVKRTSGSSTNHGSTPPVSSRDSVSTSTATSSAGTPFRHARANRDSGETDATGVTTPDISPREKGSSSVAAGDVSEEHVPPVPPLPKDLSSLKPVPNQSMGVAFPTTAHLSEAEYRSSDSSGVDRRVSLERRVSGKSTRVERTESLLKRERHPTTKSHRLSSYGSPPDVDITVSKTPSKKWSFSNALNIKLSASPSSSSKDSPAYPKSPRGAAFGVQSQKSEGSERARTTSVHQPAWTPSSDAMASAASLASLSSTSSALISRSPKPGTDRSSATQTPSAPTSAGAQAPLSPASSVRREQKRLTPSSIPFFRRSSSQSMQGSSNQNMGPPPSTMPSSTYLTPRMLSKRGSVDDSGMSSSEAPTTAKKSSVLSLGLPSLLKSSSSRRSLHADKVEAKELKEIQRAGREAEKEREKQLKAEKAVKDAKDRSESRISSVLMGRKRGKVRPTSIQSIKK